jgi:hypothetical protein
MWVEGLSRQSRRIYRGGEAMYTASVTEHSYPRWAWPLYAAVHFIGYPHSFESLLH